MRRQAVIVNVWGVGGGGGCREVARGGLNPLRVWAPAPDRPEDKLVPATRYGIGDSLFGLEAYPGREGQLDLVLWSERIRAVIASDTLIDLGDGLEIPASWLREGVTVEQVATGPRPLLDKPVDIVPPTHGEPTDRAALDHALA
jgi:hypothetical protein